MAKKPKRGAPKKPAAEKHSERLDVGVRPAVHRALEQFATASHKAIAEVVRDALAIHLGVR